MCKNECNEWICLIVFYVSVSWKIHYFLIFSKLHNQKVWMRLCYIFHSLLRNMMMIFLFGFMAHFIKNWCCAASEPPLSYYVRSGYESEGINSFMLCSLEENSSTKARFAKVGIFFTLGFLSWEILLIKSWKSKKPIPLCTYWFYITF